MCAAGLGVQRKGDGGGRAMTGYVIFYEINFLSNIFAIFPDSREMLFRWHGSTIYENRYETTTQIYESTRSITTITIHTHVKNRRKRQQNYKQ